MKFEEGLGQSRLQQGFESEFVVERAHQVVAKEGFKQGL